MSPRSFSRDSRRTRRSRYAVGAASRLRGLLMEPLEDRRLLSTLEFIKNIGVNTNVASDTSMSITVPSEGVKSGHAVIVELSMDPKVGAVSATDSAGNVYHVDKDVVNKPSGSANQGVRTVVLSSEGVKPLVAGQKITVTYPSAKAKAISAAEFCGIDAVNPVDLSKSGIGTSSNPVITTGSASTTNANDLLIGVVGVQGFLDDSLPLTGGFTPGASYTALAFTGTPSGNSGNNNVTLFPEYQIVSATGNYQASGVLSTNAGGLWATAMVAYKADAATHFEVVAPASVGGEIPFSVTVRAKDSANNNVPGYTGTVHFSVSNPVTGEVLPVDYTFTTADAGQHTFTNGFTLIGGGARTITATDECGALTGSTVVNVLAPHLAFAQQPTNTVAGTAISPAVTVRVENADNSLRTTSIDTITMSIQSGPGTFTGGSTVSVAAVGGIATFSDLHLNTAGTYTLLATNITNAAIGSAVSTSFIVIAGVDHHLTFLQQPTNTAAGASISPAVTVQIVDQFNNLTSSTANVTMAIGTNPGSGTLSGTSTIAAVGGVATFANLSINKAGVGYTLTAASSGLTGATSNTFNIIAAAADHLLFLQQPTNTTAGVAISPAVTVQIVDQFNNLTSSTANVTMAIGTNPGGGTLSGTSTIAAVGGMATFANLSINKAGVGYTLTAASAGLAGATSNTFNIIAAAAHHLLFSQQPTNTTAGTAISPAVTVQIVDQFNNLTSSTANVTMAIGTNPGGGTLSGTSTAAAVGGVATFSNLSIDKAGVGYTLTAASTGLTGATSNTFNIIAAAAHHLLFLQQPTNTGAGAIISPAVTVQIVDQFNNLTSSTANVTMAIGTNPSGGTLSGTSTIAAVGGVATFSNLSIDKVGVGYTLTAASAGLTGATSNTFNIVAAAAHHLLFLQQPTNTTAGVAISPAVTVQIVDQFNNLTTSTANVTMAIGTNPGGGTLSGTTTIAAVGGVATFANLSINKAGVGYTLTAASSGLSGATSNTFNIIAAAAHHLLFSQQPTNTTAGAAISPAVTVQIVDQFNNLTSSTANVTMAIGTNPGSGTLSGTSTIAAAGGVATFSNLSIDKVGVGYTLTAASAGLTGATSSSFNIIAAAAHHLLFLQQPTNTGAGATISPAVTVQIVDQFNNLTSSTANVTMAIGTNPGGGTLSGTSTIAAVSGVATFANLSINKAGVGYTLTAASAGLTGATSNTFNIIAAAAHHLLFSQQPTNTAAGAAISPAVTVQIVDQFNNLISSTANVTMAIGTNPGGGVLSGTSTIAAVGGVATFSNLSINKAGVGYTLTAASTGLTGATSSSFNIIAAAADHLLFLQQPTNTTAGAVINPAVTVQIVDQFNNLTSSTANVTMAIGTNPGSGTLSGTSTIAAVGGVATFGNLSIDKVGVGYTLTAASAGLTGATSSSFNIVAAAAHHLLFLQQPTNALTGATISPAVTVQIVDQFNNLTGSTANVTMAIGTNPGSGTLSGTTTAAAVGGVATFSSLSINKAGVGYTLTAASAGLTGATSSPFDITFQLVTISGQKFNDLNGNGVKETGESGLAGWIINLDLNNDGSVDQTATTDANGNYTFADVGPGTHLLSEVAQPGWVQTAPAAPGTYTVTTQSGVNLSNLDFGNRFVGASFDFNDLNSPTAAGYVAVPSFYQFNSATGFGWQTSPPYSGFDRGGPDDFRRDGQYGSADNTFQVRLPNGLYRLDLVIGDAAFARDNIYVYAEGNLVQGNISFSGGSFVYPSALVAVTDGMLDIRFHDDFANGIGADPFWVVNALTVRALNLSAHTITGPGSALAADGATVDTYTATGAAPNALITVLTDFGTVVSPDADAFYVGTQVLSDASGNFSFNLLRPTGAATAHIFTGEVLGSGGGTINQSYVLLNHRLLDFNDTSSPTAAGAFGVAAFQTYDAQKGYGWLTAPPQSGFDRGGPDSLLRDGHYGSADNTFQVQVVPQAEYMVTLYFRDTFSRDQIYVSADGTQVVSNLALPTNTTVTRSFTVSSADGILDLLFHDGGGDPFWIINAIELNLQPVPAKFFVVDATADSTFKYDASVNSLTTTALAAGDTNARGVAANVAGTRAWVVDGNQSVYVYNGDGALQGSWAALGLTQPEGIASNGTDIWIVDNGSDRVYKYSGTANRLAGSQSADSSFPLQLANGSPKDIVTNGTNLWVIDDTSDKIFKYTTSGVFVSSWSLNVANGSPTGITLDPSGASTDIWTIDSATDRIYQYTNALGDAGGILGANYALAGGNTDPQGIADPPVAGSTESLSPTVAQNRLDANHDGRVTSMDVLLVINQINAGSQSERVTLSSSVSPLDVNNDGAITASDVIEIINYLNGEGNRADQAVDSALTQSDFDAASTREDDLLSLIAFDSATAKNK